MQNRLNRKKNQISAFSDFHFSSYGHFLDIFGHFASQFSMNFYDNSKNKNRENWKIDFSFVSAHYASSIKTGSKLRGGRGTGGLHILSWEIPNSYIYTILGGYFITVISILYSWVAQLQKFHLLTERLASLGIMGDRLRASAWTSPYDSAVGFQRALN